MKSLYQVVGWLSSKMGIRGDYILHFMACFALSLLGSYGAAVAIGLGIGKEYGDKYAAGNRWDWTDIAADALGIITGLTIWYFLIR